MRRSDGESVIQLNEIQNSANGAGLEIYLWSLGPREYPEGWVEFWKVSHWRDRGKTVEPWKEKDERELKENNEEKSIHKQVIIRVNHLRNMKKEVINNIIGLRLQKVIGEFQRNIVPECQSHIIFTLLLEIVGFLVKESLR